MSAKPSLTRSQLMLNKMNTLKSLFVLLTFCTPGVAGTSPAFANTEQERAVREVVDLYCYQIGEFCKGYGWAERLDIQEHLLVSLEADFSSDVPGTERNKLTAADYFNLLEKSRAKVVYAEAYQLQRCSTTPLMYGVTIDKQVIVSERDVLRYQDFIEIRLDANNEARIFAISSSRYSSYKDLACIIPSTRSRQAGQPKPSARIQPSPCPSLAEADAALAAGNSASALSLYQDALNCGQKQAYIREQINHLRTRETAVDLLWEANQAYGKGEYATAYARYQLLLGERLKPILNDSERILTQQRLLTSRRNIEFEENVLAGDYHFRNQSYEKARNAYARALTLQPTNTTVKQKLNNATSYAEGAYRKEAQREINEAVRLLRRARRFNDDASVVLMKYADTGWLTGQQLFYLIQLLDADSGRIKREFNMSQREVCVKTKLLIRQAAALSFNTDAFQVFRKSHLNKRSRTCG